MALKAQGDAVAPGALRHRTNDGVSVKGAVLDDERGGEIPKRLTFDELRGA